MRKHLNSHINVLLLFCIAGFNSQIIDIPIQKEFNHTKINGILKER